MVGTQGEEACFCLPLRPLVFSLSLVTFCVGFWHLISITLQLTVGGGDWSSTTDFHYAGSCQGTACHEEIREQILSCKGNRETSFKVRYLVIGIFGMVFGSFGMQGCLERNSAMVKCFAYYLIALAIFILAICGADNVYVLACNKLPMNMEKDVGYWIPSETLGLLHAQGHRDFSALSARKLKEILGYDFVPFIFSCYFAVMLGILYLSFTSFRLAEVVELGPVGLGPNFTISNQADREITQMKNRLMNVAADHFSTVRHHEAFQQLQDGNDFPFITSKGGSSPAIRNYGAIGVEKPLPKEAP